MGQIVSLREQKEDGWQSGEARCLACGHTWAAVAPTGSSVLECPSCGLEKGYYRYACGPGENGEVWTCNCGCQTLYATRTALRCSNCGLSQRPFD